MTFISSKVRFMLIAMCTAVAASLPLASPANATTPGRNGRITFMEPDAAGFWQVWVANADLSGQKQLTGSEQRLACVVARRQEDRLRH